MSGLSMLGGAFAFARTGSFPSLAGSFTIAGIMALSSMRIRDGMDYGLEGAAASSTLLFVPMIRRALATRRAIPSALAALAAASTAYYGKETAEHYA
ncbi:uncharacterized protein MKK02DRAFT_37975 [Dioszegia hungarica]|uniref:Uncharacterized protein n=1 Tax=Dioszegia hungarica TaxID=4972 RepID=A0AA38H7N5_9TREE|nr:uncharacterized protein MKK02DRAFT_37975 [Dioszegia hungarica]KAI9634444.1 hypothetical protein MKK02DRAFT_37975 [Dioszegia hungarica]